MRIHTNDQAKAAARGLNAEAFTSGTDIVFGAGQYDPHTSNGRQLLAHELTHVVQQGSGGNTNEVKSAPHGVVQRNESGSETRAVAPESIDDPGLKICALLCYLGIPPNFVKTAAELVSRAVWEEYSAAYDQAAAQARFREFKEEFRGYSAFKAMGRIVIFAVEGKLPMGTGALVLRARKAKALQRWLYRKLVRFGARAGTLQIASQVLRKAFLIVELAFAAGCGAYCTVEQYTRMLMKTTRLLVEGLMETVEIIEAIGGVVRQIGEEVLLRPVVAARASFDPENWDLSVTPMTVRTDLTVLGLWLWNRISDLNGDQFLGFVGKKIQDLPVPEELLRSIVTDLQPVLPPDSELTVSGVLDMTFLEFIRRLNRAGLLRFERDPDVIATEVLYGERAPEEEEEPGE